MSYLSSMSSITLSYGLMAVMAGISLGLYGTLAPTDKLWATYPILDPWLMGEYAKQVRARKHARLAGVILVIAGLAGIMIDL